MTRPRLAVPAALAALAIGAGAGLAHHEARDDLNPPRVTLDARTFEDGSSRARVRFVLPARVTDVRATPILNRRGRVIAFTVSYCYRHHACQEGRK